ncbi:MAG: hypothetical protein JWN43_4814, partial [Gammaproteobacteria bacterium]|nr:hypothetical protein [Gammaproteobacteria bacterium]
MIISDETLMAFADGELDAATCAVVEAAMRDDPDLERRVAHHRALRAQLQRAYAAELDEAPPARLVAAARGTSRPSRRSAPMRWQPMAAMAASLLVGVGVGFFVQRQAGSPIVENAGGLVARGVLDKALSNQLGSERMPGAPVQIGLSFVAKSGDYCRTFTLSAAASPAGVACRHGQEWQIRVVAQTSDGETGGESAATYRPAGSALSPVILDAVQLQISGEPLDRNGELA